jgi:hypothetical protein
VLWAFDDGREDFSGWVDGFGWRLGVPNVGTKIAEGYQVPDMKEGVKV